jgi:hypothetical protein
VDGPTETSLEGMKLGSIEELFALPTPEVARRLVDAPFPPSEKVIGAVMLKAVDDLHMATAELAAASQAMDKKTRSLVTVARATLAVAIIALVVSIILAAANA